jgi:hypothetical protein
LFFAGADILNSAAIVLPFRQGILAVSLSAGRRPTVMEVIAFQAKGSEVGNGNYKLRITNYKLPITNYKELSNR